MATEDDRISRLVAKGQQVLSTHRPHPPNVIGFPTLDAAAFAEWRTQSLACLQSLFGSGHVYAVDFSEKVTGGYPSHVQTGLGILRAAAEDLPSPMDERGAPPLGAEPLVLLTQLFERFHLVCRQLRARHDQRETLNVEDEYDVQDLLHALLWIHFEDVRVEEWTPSYAGKSSRMDFLLKAEQIVVEVKKTRPSLGAKELGSQLIDDIARYRSHPDCHALICFVYDPDGYVANPRGIEADLSRNDPFPVRVLIRPR